MEPSRKNHLFSMDGLSLYTVSQKSSILKSYKCEDKTSILFNRSRKFNFSNKWDNFNELKNDFIKNKVCKLNCKGMKRQTTNFYKEIINVIINSDSEVKYNRQKTFDKCMKQFKRNNHFYPESNYKKIGRRNLSNDSNDGQNKSKFIFLPRHKCVESWQLIINLFLFYVTFMLTYELSFIDSPTMFFRVSEYITSIVFFFDILFNMNLAYYNSKNKLVSKRKKIIISYLKFWFWMDLVSAFPFYLISDFKNSSITQNLKTAKIFKYIKIVRLARLIKFIRCFCPKSFQNRTDFHKLQLKSNAERLLQHLIFALILSHFFACLFYALPMHFYPNFNWIFYRGLQNRPAFQKYLFSMHWMIETVITVGYGENQLRYAS